MVDWGPIESTPYPGEPGGVPADITADPFGGLNDPSVVLPESAVQLVEPDGTHVAWLAHAKTWTYRRGKGDPGSGHVTLARSDPLLADAVFPRQLRFFDRGLMRARSLIEPRSDTSISASEESGEEAALGGPGAFALTARGRVDPIRLDLQPKQGSVRFSFAHEDYDDTVDGWEPAVDVGEYPGRPTDSLGGGTNITGPSGDHDFSPGGTYYFRAPDVFTLAEDTDVQIELIADNIGRAYLDGIEAIALATFDANNYIRSHTTRLRLSAGDHFLAATSFNQSSDEPGPSGNPGFIRIVVRDLDSNGQPGDVLAATGDDWLCYEFLQSRPPELTRPGWTAGQIIIWLRDRWEERTGFALSRSFDGVQDSDGEDWPIILDFTATIGSLFDALNALAEVHCDLDWSPASDEIHAWLKDTRGTDLSATVELPAGYDSEAGCIFDLSHRTEPPLLTSALVEWRDAFVIVEDDEADPVVERKIDAPLVNTEAAAEIIGAAAVAVFGVERVQGTGAFLPRDDTQRPGLGFDVADTISAPNRELELVAQVVQSYTHTADNNGQIRWQLEYGDAMFDQEERFANWLKGIANGHIGGRTFQTMPYREEVRAAETPPDRLTQSFFRQLGEDEESAPFWVRDHAVIHSWSVVEFPSSEHVVELRVNGTMIDNLTPEPAAKSAILNYKVEPDDLVTTRTDDDVGYVATVWFES